MITLYKQIYPKQCKSLSQMGYKTLINLRCDGECDSQPCTQSLKKSTESLGLVWHHFPIDGETALDTATVTAFATLINNSPKPVMVFCGTGGRAKRLYQSAKILGLLD